MGELKLFLVHCGYYDPEIGDAIYESHMNFMVVAESFEDARAKVKLEPEFKLRRMHVDGLQMIEAVRGYRVTLVEDAALAGASKLESSRHRDLAPKPASPSTASV